MRSAPAIWSIRASNAAVRSLGRAAGQRHGCRAGGRRGAEAGSEQQGECGDESRTKHGIPITPRNPPEFRYVIWYIGPSPPSGGVSRPPLAVIAPHCTQFEGFTIRSTCPFSGASSGIS